MKPNERPGHLCALISWRTIKNQTSWSEFITSCALATQVIAFSFSFFFLFDLCLLVTVQFKQLTNLLFFAQTKCLLTWKPDIYCSIKHLLPKRLSIYQACRVFVQIICPAEWLRQKEPDSIFCFVLFLFAFAGSRAAKMFCLQCSSLDIEKPAVRPSLVPPWNSWF